VRQLLTPWAAAASRASGAVRHAADCGTSPEGQEQSLEFQLATVILSCHLARADQHLPNKSLVTLIYSTGQGRLCFPFRVLGGQQQLFARPYDRRMATDRTTRLADRTAFEDCAPRARSPHGRSGLKAHSAECPISVHAMPETCASNISMTKTRYAECFAPYSSDKGPATSTASALPI